MGNTLASSQISDNDVEKYLNEISPSLVSQHVIKNRFLKTVKCISEEGNVIVKIFVKNHPISLKEKYGFMLEELKAASFNSKHLLRNPNSAPYTKFGETEKIGYLIRQHFNTTLSERLNMNPFLKNIEKKWITYQLLKYLERCTFNGLPHGDLKCENIMVTSWNWVYVTDNAYPFKPTHLPLENNGFYSYYFDISQKRICYIAPERLISDTDYTASSSELDESMFENEDGSNRQYTHLMDIFSMGCVIAELWTDGKPLFSYPELLAYKEGKYSPNSKIEKIEDKNIQELIFNMISLNPDDRMQPNNYLDHFTKNKTFPNYFEILFEYIYELMSLETDDRVNRIHSDFDILKQIFIEDFPISNDDIRFYKKNQNLEQLYQIKLKNSLKSDEKNSSQSDEKKDDLHESKADNCFGERYENHGNNFKFFNYYMELIKKKELIRDIENETKLKKSEKIIDGLVIILDMLCSILKYLNEDKSKLLCLDYFEKISECIEDVFIFDRVIPYILSLIDGEHRDPSSLVRAQAIRSLSNVLAIVKELPVSEIHIFQQYILPTLNFMRENDKEDVVLEAYAASISQFAESAKRFVEMSQFIKSKKSLETNPTEKSNILTNFNYNYELKEIRDSFRDVIMSMLHNDAPIIVKKAVLTDIAKLCRFFGQEETERSLLKLIISCLNSKHWELRSAIFENIIGITKIIGPYVMEQFLFPCVLPEIYNASEYIIEGIITCLSSLSRLGMFKKQRLFEICEKTSPLLLHPNAWIRFGTISIITSVADQLSIADVHSFLIPCIRKFLIRDISTIDSKSLLSSLKSPISRKVYERAISITINNIAYPNEPLLKESDLDPNLVNIVLNYYLKHHEKENTISCNIDIGYASAISELEVSAEDEHKLFVMKDYIIQCITDPSRKYNMEVNTNQWKDIFKNLSKEKPVYDPIKSSNKQSSISPLTNSTSQDNIDSYDKDSEWNEIFEGSKRDTPVMSRQSSRASLLNSQNQLRRTESLSSLSTTNSSNNNTPVRTITISQKSLTPKTSRSSLLDTDTLIRSPLDGSPLKFGSKTHIPNWRPKGQLIGILYGHNQPVNDICVSSDFSFCATASEDGLVKVWDCNKIGFELKKIELRCKLTAMTICDQSHSIASACSDGTIKIVTFGSGYDTSAYQINGIEGEVVKLTHIESSSRSTLVYAMDNGKVSSYDFRSDRNPFKFEIKRKFGNITSMVVDPSSNWIVVSTLRGCILCWDLRFNIPVFELHLEDSIPIYELSYIVPENQSPTKTNILMSTGNGLMMNMDLSEPKIDSIYRVSEPNKDDDLQIPVLKDANFSNLLLDEYGRDVIRSNKYTVKNVFKSMITTRISKSAIFTAGTDKSIRYWDTNDITKSYIISGPDKDQKRAYNKKMYDDCKLFEESYLSQDPIEQNTNTSMPYTTPETYHNDSILGMAVIEYPSKVLLSASKDGSIKVWR